MTPILDPQGNPLPPSDDAKRRAEIADILGALCERYTAMNKWPDCEKRFEALLSWLEPNAPMLHGLLTGQCALDASTPDGRELVTRCFDAVLTMLVLRRREQEASLDKDAKIMEQGGMASDGSH